MLRSPTRILATHARWRSEIAISSARTCVQTGSKLNLNFYNTATNPYKPIQFKTSSSLPATSILGNLRREGPQRSSIVLSRRCQSII